MYKQMIPLGDNNGRYKQIKIVHNKNPLIKTNDEFNTTKPASQSVKVTKKELGINPSSFKLFF